ncbi:MAG: tetratricopeptide repeat protein [Pyrinomonadaceae bacterium]
MKLRFLQTLVITALLTALVGASYAQTRSITISTEPSATVWIDGVRYGKADSSGKLAIKTVAAGTHTLRVRLDGFKEKTQALSAAQRGEIKIALVKTTDEAELAFQEAERLTTVDREKAAEAFKRAITLRPSYLEAHIALARVLSEAGDLDGARKALASARRIRPGFAEVSAIEGRIQKENGEEQKAIAAFKRAITEGRGFQPEAYTGLGLLYKEKAEGAGGSGDFDGEEVNYAESTKYLKTALKQLSGAPDAIIIYQLLGLIYERQKKPTEAIQVYEEFLRFFPDTVEAEAVRSFIVQLKKDQVSPK